MKTAIPKYKNNNKTKQEIIHLCNKIKNESQKNFSAINQLKNVVQISLTGIDVPNLTNSKNQNLDFGVLSEILFLTRKLFDINYQKQFECMIEQMDKETQDEIILALINFLLFIDNYSYQRIAQDYPQDVYFLPIKTALKLKDKLSRDKINSIGCELFTLRFPNNIRYAGVSVFDKLVPDAIDVAKVFLKHQDLATSTDNLIFSFLRYLNIYEARNIESGIQKILRELDLESSSSEKIIKYCKTYRIIETNNKEKLEICKKAYSAIKKNPFIDAIDIEISENVNTINIILFTGAFVGFTVAHHDTVQLMQNLNKQNDNELSQSIIVIAPITRPWDVPEKILGKTPELIGPINPRVEAIMMGLALSKRENILITTKGVPDPKETCSPQERIIKIEKNLERALQGKRPKLKVNFTRGMGVDDVNKMLSEARNGKYSYNLLFISRRGSFVDVLENLSAIQETGTARIIITPGIRNTSSSMAMSKHFDYKDDTYWPVPVIPIVDQNWSPRSRKLKAKNKARIKNHVPNINQIHEKLIATYLSYLSGMTTWKLNL